MLATENFITPVTGGNFVSLMGNHMKKVLPSFRGLRWHRHQFYSFFVPYEWQRADWPDDREGVIYTPSADDPLTLIAVEVRDLGVAPTPDDLDDLQAGLLAGIEALPDVEVEHHEQWIRGSLMCLEAKYSFVEDGARRKRWVRQFYHETRQIAMTAQGATCETYDYWLPMFFEAMMTTKIHNSIPQLDSDAFVV